MPEVNQNTDPDVTPVTTSPTAISPQPKTGDSNSADFEAAVAAAVAEQLKEMKTKVDKAYSQRDETLAQAEELKQKLTEQETQRLKAEGKELEALELQLAQEKAKSETLARRNIELTRDLELKNVLSKYDFRSDKASKMAFSEITGQLIQNENGSWQGKNGDTVEKVITDFMTSEDNEFLLKPKANTGGGDSTVASTKTSSSSTSTSLFGKTQAEVLKMAAEGKFR